MFSHWFIACDPLFQTQAGPPLTRARFTTKTNVRQLDLVQTPGRVRLKPGYLILCITLTKEGPQLSDSQFGILSRVVSLESFFHEDQGKYRHSNPTAQEIRSHFCCGAIHKMKNKSYSVIMVSLESFFRKDKKNYRNDSFKFSSSRDMEPLLPWH